MSVGEMARRTGVSVRTLHYYEEVGLIAPSRRTEAGHRRYGAVEIARLQQIKSLQQMGFSLEEIRACMGRPDYAPLPVIELHRARLREQIALLTRLCERLDALASWLRSSGAVPTEEFLRVIEVMTMVEKYYTPGQLEWLQERRQQVGEERIRQVEAEWPRLIAEVRAEMERGTDPADPRVQELARRWTGMVEEFTGGNPEIARAVQTLYEQEPSAREQAGIDQALCDYVARASASTNDA